MKSKKFNVVYEGKIVAENLSYEQATDALHEIALEYYTKNLDINEIKLEEIN